MLGSLGQHQSRQGHAGNRSGDGSAPWPRRFVEATPASRSFFAPSTKWATWASPLQEAPALSDALGLLEVKGWSASMAALDAAEKAGNVRVLQVEINDMLGAQIKLLGSTSDVGAALAAGRAVADGMQAECVTKVMARPHAETVRVVNAKSEFSPLIEQDLIVRSEEHTS